MQPFSEIYHQKSSSQHDRQSQRGLPSKSAGCIGSIEITSRPSNDPVDRNANPPVTATARIAVTAAIIPRHDRRRVNELEASELSVAFTETIVEVVVTVDVRIEA
ncbi:hypothetical protein KXW35_008417, partial [Aspergillus fumigatus]